VSALSLADSTLLHCTLDGSEGELAHVCTVKQNFVNFGTFWTLPLSALLFVAPATTACVPCCSPMDRACSFSCFVVFSLAETSRLQDRLSDCDQQG
jgi:hypothetical protein